MANKSYSTNSVSSELGIGGVLQIVFIVLKCCGLIDWPWVVVLIPLWIDLSLAAVWLFVGITILLINNNRLRKGRK